MGTVTNMARVIKGNSFDDGQFPMPDSPHTDSTRQLSDPAFSGVEPAELQHSLGELAQMVGMINGMRPAVQELSESLRNSATEQGYQEGIARAQSEVQSQLLEVISALTAAQQERYSLALQHEGVLADLALQIARKVIGAHLEADPTLVTRIVQHAINELEPSTSLEVRVSPHDLAQVEASRREIERLVLGGGRVEIVADEQVAPGGVLLVSPVGEVDARIETKLSVLETAFTAQRRALVDG